MRLAIATVVFSASTLRLCRLWMFGTALLLLAGCAPTRPSRSIDQAILDHCKVPVYISRTAAGTQCLSQCEERGIQCGAFCHDILCVCECHEAETVCIEGCPDLVSEQEIEKQRILNAEYKKKLEEMEAKIEAEALTSMSAEQWEVRKTMDAEQWQAQLDQHKLTGWYLMAPPPQWSRSTRLPTTKPDFNAPLRRWHTFDVFGNAEQCETGRLNAPARLRKLQNQFKSSQTEAQQEARLRDIEKENGWPKGFIRALGRYDDVRLSFAKCIASDDPRLKGTQR
jgi:hypothetical protein